MKALALCTAFALALCLCAAPLQAQTDPYDRSEANRCASCHYYPANVVQPFVAEKWFESNHAWSSQGYNQNTYCAKCHSPFEADPNATHGDNLPVPDEHWQAITCSSCHPPHDLRVEWGTPIGNYDVPEQKWVPVYEEEANDLCEHCHEGTRHEQDFKGWGQTMFEKKSVRCIDCHMAKIPNPAEAGRMTYAHDMKVEDNLPYSCGAVEGGCHSNHDEGWALKQIEKSKLHGKDK